MLPIKHLGMCIDKNLTFLLAVQGDRCQMTELRDALLFYSPKVTEPTDPRIFSILIIIDKTNFLITQPINPFISTCNIKISTQKLAATMLTRADWIVLNVARLLMLSICPVGLIQEILDTGSISRNRTSAYRLIFHQT